MQVVHENSLITFDWEHGRDLFGRFTRCDVFVLVNGKNPDNGYTYGVAYCNPNDQFVKDKGRKMSLARAIKEFPREVRVKIWEAYLNR